MENIHKNIGGNLRNIRRSRGLSLDMAAEATGVSKAMLGQIERGESNPTVTTLWKIASGLQISFSSLMAEKSSEVSFASISRINPIIENEGKYKVFPLFPFDPRKKFEIFIVEIAPDWKQTSDQHNEGVEEYITVISGEIEVIIGGRPYRIQEGSALRFAADQTHSYRNTGEAPAKCQVVMYYE
ncbi:helix-turn-helix domain-containing protein [Bacillus infantis]|uniref:Helix-turn-helix domain-containing protein n=1 Tax=Bacillus infantis TaxID=324767 RepID=A0A5D4SLT8_9BACI|nr:XRE family transcriptional regulator [Bacillus infantis]TYS62696.1 helix-turn-helix domain-containing protein [Bacillus infantis]